MHIGWGLGPAATARHIRIVTVFAKTWVFIR